MHNVEVLEERIVHELLESEKSSKITTMPLSSGGHITIKTDPNTARVGLFNLSIDGNVSSLDQIATEPYTYDRPVYSHNGEMDFRIVHAIKTVDSWFIALNDELIATGPLERPFDLSNLQKLTLEGPLLEFS